MNRINLIIFTLLLSVSSVNAQFIDKFFKLMQPQETTVHYKARDYVEMLPGFSVDATTGITFIAEIDPNIIIEAEYDQPVIPFSTNRPIGSIVSNIEISPSGATIASIPVILPQGIMEMQPTLSINYSSQSGNGFMGIGWNISGFSAISRTATTIYHEGFLDPIDFDANDNLSMDGQRLIQVGNEGAFKKYFTEVANFDKILAAGASDNDPNYFILKSKDGKTIYYGNTTNSRIESTSSTYSTKGLFWLINKIEDNNGNYAEYEYLERNGTFYPKQINYTGNASIAPKCSVKFYYVEREDKTFGFIGNGRIEQDLLLYKIETFQNGNKVNTYEFRYNYADDNFSQLSEIVFYNSSMQFYNSTKITWGDESPNEILTERLNSEPNFNKGYLNIPADFNGDGKTDLVTIQEMNFDMFFWYGTSASNNTIIFGDIYDLNPEKIFNAVPGDFNGDGYSDLIVISKEDETKEKYKFWFYRIKERTYGTRLEITKFFLFESSDKEIDIGDFNGDGQTDFMHTTGNTIILYSIINNALFVHNSYDIDKLKETYLGDFNGDGKTDIMAISGKSPNCRIYDKDALFYQSDDWNKNDFIKIGDFNADGKSDVLWWKDEVWKLRFYTGTSFTEAITANLPYSENDPDDKKNGIFVSDYNGDGKQDVLIFSENDTKRDTATDVNVCYFKYDNFSDIVYSDTWNNFKPHENNFITNNDFNGDGRVDVLCWLYEELGQGYEHVFAIYQNQTNPELNFVHSITDGFNTVTEIEYKPLTDDDIYTKSKDQEGDVTTYQFPLYVASKLKTQNGIGGWFEKTYQYENFMIHRKGKGILGFEKLIIEENTSYNIYETVFEYNPTYFNVGIKASYIKRGNSTISEIIFNNQIKWNSGKRILPIVKSQTSTDVLKDITKTTIYNYDDYGNPLNIRDFFENGTETYTEYSYTDNGSWCNYLVQYEKTTKKRQGQQNYVRQTDYEYYSNGNLFKVINDEDKPDFTITSTYKDYNQFGQAQTVEVTNLDLTKISTYQFDNYGNMISSTNPLDQTFVFTYDNVTGNILSETDFNGLKTRYFYDAFENLTQTIFPDNTVEYYENKWNTDNYFSNSIFYKKHTNIDGTYSIVYFDRLGRKIYGISNSFNGDDIVSKVLYNDKGQKYRTYEPYYLGQTPDKFTEYSYYIDGRLKKITAPTNVVENIYNDAELLTTTKVFDKNNTFLKSYSSKIDKSGYTIQKTDAGGTINYTYYASGLLEKTTYQNSEVVVFYDLHGNKTSITDPDAGTSTYTYDAWGNLLSQTNANGYTTTMNYDILGRVETIQADEGIINYHYNQQGRLYNIFDEGTGYSKTFNYDDLGRLLTSTENIDNQDFVFSYTYDNLGRTKTVTYPSGFSTRNVFNNNGYLQQIVNNDNNNLIWKLNEMNQFGQITQTQFGNGKTTTYGYDEFHLPQSVYSPDIVNREYLFEPGTGNLKTRTDFYNTIEEVFEYDNLDRLTDIQYNGSAQKTINYFSNGNIDNVTGIGDYSYNDPAHLHAVTEVENTDNSIPSFAYDVEYTSFNSAKLLSDNEGNEYEITYSYDQNRVKTQFINSGNVEKTKYYIGAYEREETSAGTRELNYITTPDGLAAVYEMNNSDNQMHYINTDYLGSIVAVSKQNGYLEQDYYYSAWGQRQILNNHLANTSFILDRGYTGHEHIDEFGLINMNARLYDPYIGRMLSPDNYVQDISNTQNFNRYSYVLNNPLKYTDPSGNFVWLVPISFTKYGYEFWKTFSPIAIKIDLHAGTTGFGIGFDVSIGIPKIIPISYRIHFGATYYQNTYGYYGHANGAWETRRGAEWTLFNFINYSGTTFTGLGKDQTLNKVSFGNYMFNIGYENDTELLNFPGVPNHDGGDRWRTASFNYRVGVFEAGMLLHTGMAGGATGYDWVGTGVRGDPQVFDGGTIDDPEYRAGILYFGTQNIRFGVNHDKIRHLFQNRVAHDRFFTSNYGAKYAWVRDGDVSNPLFYFYLGTGFSDSNW